MAVSKNQQAVQAFAAHFEPPLVVVATKKVGGAPVADGWMCALQLPEQEIGLTAVCWGKGYFKAWAEATGTREEADTLGWIFASLLQIGAGAQNAEEGAQAAENIQATLVAPPPPFASPAPTSPAESTPSPLTDAERAAFQAVTQLLPEVPNPEFIDMGGLTPVERLAIAHAFPELRYAIHNDGRRMRIDEHGQMVEDPTAGFVRADQLEHVRRVRGLPGATNTARSVPRMTRGAPSGGLAGDFASRQLAAFGDSLCEHDFQKNSIGGMTTCRKCGIQGPKAAPVTTDADAEYAALQAQRGEERA